MATRRIGIIMHGATSRIGTTQHLLNSLVPIRQEGGLPLANGDRLLPDPILVGRTPEKLQALAERFGLARWTTDLDAALADPQDELFFECAYGGGRAQLAHRALRAGKHIYLEKPVADTLVEVEELRAAAEAAGRKHAVMQDKIHLPGLVKLKTVLDLGTLGRLLSMKLEFGWWVFDGEVILAQRTSWNYRKATGGGLVLDMFPHWRYVIDHLFGAPTALTCHMRTAQPKRWDERRLPYDVDVEDEARAILEFPGGLVGEVFSSWATRIRRDDMLVITAEGTQGSAACTLHQCWVQTLANTPKPVFPVQAPQAMDFRSQWAEVPEMQPFKNSYRQAWEAFLRHVAEDAPNTASLLQAVRGLQLIEACHRSHEERRWVDLPELRA
ncbi:Gfo/Idh/MocA family protein [Paracraurococcus ruber]|uniref:Oxidoreductase n=1 Tax=Paracraurococcus ruber TaxID=77675 RepID=A0ABS1CYU0_9PROT|nr:Gfo/Idh/MocA family oxidoreductase [Paracraurococcus ruber]MBK1659463.1 oxidoreductase [Paracraurococcus ruber]TDG33469.1 Gfo/Idh/MocA family oxidoreductase [Paracraurococcus ruber]